MARDGGAPLAVCGEEAGEDLDLVQPRPGLGLVPFAVDVHATQWGTLTRLIHAVALGLVAEGVAIDEGTCLEVHGAGAGEPARARAGQRLPRAAGARGRGRGDAVGRERVSAARYLGDRQASCGGAVDPFSVTCRGSRRR